MKNIDAILLTILILMFTLIVSTIKLVDNQKTIQSLKEEIADQSYTIDTLMEDFEAENDCYTKLRNQ